MNIETVDNLSEKTQPNFKVKITLKYIQYKTFKIKFSEQSSCYASSPNFGVFKMKIP